MSSWNPNIPQVANIPANDAIAMQQNFAQLNASFQVDHVPLSDKVPPGGNSGMHKQITFPSPPASLPFGAVAQQSYLYEKIFPNAVPIFPNPPGPATKSYLEYQSAGAVPFIIPLSLKMWCIFTPTLVVPFINIIASFNVNTTTSSSTGTFVTLNFIDAMPSINYMIFTGVFASGVASPVVPATTTNKTVDNIVLCRTSGNYEHYVAVL